MYEQETFHGIKIVYHDDIRGNVRGYARWSAIHISRKKTENLTPREFLALLEHEYQHILDMHKYHIFFFATYAIFIPFGKWCNPWELRSELVEYWVEQTGSIPKHIKERLGR